MEGDVLGCILLLVAGAKGACAREQVLRVIGADQDNKHPILLRVCRPATDTPARLVVINHGSTPSEADRAQTKLRSCRGETAQWFVQRGFVVAFPLRRGYGPTGGRYMEGFGACENPSYGPAGLETAKDIDVAVNAVTVLPYVQPDHVVVAGISGGAWGALAYDSVAHPHVSAFLVLAAGRGGHFRGTANANCRPDLLAQAAGQYGLTARTPSLWIYATNDTFFAPTIAKLLHAPSQPQADCQSSFRPACSGARDTHYL